MKAARALRSGRVASWGETQISYFSDSISLNFQQAVAACDVFAATLIGHANSGSILIAEIESVKFASLYFVSNKTWGVAPAVGGDAPVLTFIARLAEVTHPASAATILMAWIVQFPTTTNASRGMVLQLTAAQRREVQQNVAQFAVPLRSLPFTLLFATEQRDGSISFTYGL